MLNIADLTVALRAGDRGQGPLDRGERGRVRRPRRPQRRRQDHDAVVDRRARCRPAAGTITFDGAPIDGASPDAILRRGIALVPESRRIFARLVGGGEPARSGRSARRDRGAAARGHQRDARALPGPGRNLREARARSSPAASSSSSRSRGRCCRPRACSCSTSRRWARAADRRPRVRDPRGAPPEGSTILLVEQNAARTIEAADRTYVLRTGGQVQFHGTASELAARGDFETAYIGHGGGGRRMTVKASVPSTRSTRSPTAACSPSSRSRWPCSSGSCGS